MKLVTDFPSQAHAFERLNFSRTRIREQMAVDHGIEEPFPILSSNIRDKPGKTLAVEANLRGKSSLNEEVGYRPLSFFPQR
jgi:hypothetical protein